MKKIILTVLTILLLPMITIRVNAASAPYEWIVGGESVNSKPNSAGTARQVKDGNLLTLYLENYDGGKLELKCYGTGQSDMKFVINLVGDNKIKSDDIGIDMGESNNTKLLINGPGTLTITAPTPISNEDYKDIATFNPSKVAPSEESKNESNRIEKEENKSTEEVEKTEETEKVEEDTKETKKNTNAKEDEDEKKLISSNKKDNNNLIYIIFGVYAVVSLAVIIFLAIKLKKN